MKKITLKIIIPTLSKKALINRDDKANSQLLKNNLRKSLNMIKNAIKNNK